jgi:hypothetical protein
MGPAGKKVSLRGFIGFLYTLVHFESSSADVAREVFKTAGQVDSRGISTGGGSGSTMGSPSLLFAR